MSEQDEPLFETTAGPLGPGDDDPRSPAKGARVATNGPQTPGDGGDDRFHTLTPPPPGPGDPQTGPRTLTQIPRKPAVAPREEDKE